MLHIIVSIVLAVLFVLTGSPKIIGLAFSAKGRRALKLEPWFWRLTGSLEVLGGVGLVVGLWVAPIGIAAASALTLFMIAAAVARIRAVRIAGKPLSLVTTGVAIDTVVALIALADVILIAAGV